jgi:hypothetical protein
MKIQDHALIIRFNYFGFDFLADARLISLTSNYAIYEIKLRLLRYLIVNTNEEWEFIADLQPCQKLKELIVMHLKESFSDHLAQLNKAHLIL